MDLCDRFHCLPSQLLAEDAGLLRMVKMVDLYRPRKEVNDGSGAE